MFVATRYWKNGASDRSRITGSDGDGNAHGESGFFHSRRFAPCRRNLLRGIWVVVAFADVNAVRAGDQRRAVRAPTRQAPDHADSIGIRALLGPRDGAVGDSRVEGVVDMRPVPVPGTGRDQGPLPGQGIERPCREAGRQARPGERVVRDSSSIRRLVFA